MRESPSELPFPLLSELPLFPALSLRRPVPSSLTSPSANFRQSEESVAQEATSLPVSLGLTAISEPVSSRLLLAISLVVPVVDVSVSATKVAVGAFSSAVAAVWVDAPLLLLAALLTALF